jgi:predicted transcriptional regulator
MNPDTFQHIALPYIWASAVTGVALAVCAVLVKIDGDKVKKARADAERSSGDIGG